MYRFLIIAMLLPLALLGVVSPDSLELNLQHLSHIGKIDLLNNSAEELVISDYNYDVVRALGYSQRALNLARRINDVDREIKSLIMIGECYRFLGDFDKAMSYFLDSYYLNEKIDDPEGLASTIRYIGKVYYYIENYEMALSFYRKALSYLKEDEKHLRADLFCEIADTYLARLETNHAIAYYGIAEELYSNIGNQQGVYRTQTHIGEAYLDMGEYNRAISFYIDLIDRFDKPGFEIPLSGSCTNLAWAYFKIGDFEQSLKYNIEAMKRRKGGTKEMYGSSLRNIGVLYYNWGKLDLAREYLDKAIEALKPFRTIVARRYIRDCYRNYYQIYSGKKNYEKALDYYILYDELDDSLATRDANERIAKLNAAYEIERNSRESELVQKNMEISNLTIKRRTLALLLVGVVLLLVIIISLFIFTRYRRKLVASNELKQAVEERTIELREEIKTVERIGNSLRNSENTLRTIFNSVHDAIMILDRNGRVLSVNKQALNLFQTAEQSALASYFQFDFSHKSNPLSQLSELWRKVLDGQTIILEWLSCDPKGSFTFESEVVFSRIEYLGKEAIIASIRDITMRKKGEKNQIELERKSSALAMAVTANHELNQPLMILRGSVEMLEMTTPTEQLNEKQTQYFRNINKSIQRIQKILEQFKQIESVEYDEYTDNEYMVKFDDNHNIDGKV